MLRDHVHQPHRDLQANASKRFVIEEVEKPRELAAFDLALVAEVDQDGIEGIFIHTLATQPGGGVGEKSIQTICAVYSFGCREETRHILCAFVRVAPFTPKLNRYQCRDAC